MFLAKRGDDKVQEIAISVTEGGAWTTGRLVGGNYRIFSFCLFVCLLVCLFVYLLVNVFVCLCCLFVCLFVCLFIC